ncbi:MAG: type IV secretion system DNA-binding domain-containing protein [bacterium]|nr:type IV secretion system DNA-binding domain-containing protein [bacterium]
MIFLYFLPIIVLAIGFLVVWILLGKGRKITRLSQSLKMSLFLVKMPRYEKKKDEKEKQDIKLLIEQMEQIYSQFLYLKSPNFFKRVFQGYKTPRIALELASEVGGPDISFYIAVPNYMETGIEKNIQGVFPQAVIEKVPQDYTVFEPQAKVAGARLFLQKPLYFPIQTFKKLEKDPLATLTNALSKIKPEEGAAIQIIVRSTKFELKKQGEKMLSEITEKGANIKSAMAQAGKSQVADWAGTAFNAIAVSNKKEDASSLTPKGGGVSEAVLEAVKSKIQKPILEVNIRLLGVAQDKERAEEILSHLEAGFSQFSSALNGFEISRVKERKIKKFVYDFSFRDFNEKERVILNLEELTSLYHFPLPHIESPQIRWAKTKESAPPSNLPNQGLNLIGNVLFRNEEKPVYFASREDRRRHFYVVGQTGTGKSSLLREMIRQDILAGEGVALIDPNGDLIEHTLANIPKERIDDVVLFEPFDMKRPCGLNMLEWKTPEQKDFAISEMITIYSKLFPPEIIGPMFEHYMRNAMLLLMADKDNPGTLVDIPRLFTDKEFMEGLLKKVTDPLVRSFWLKEWGQTTGQTKSDMLGYVVSKVGRFVENEMMRNIIGQSKSTFDLEDIMNNKKIFLANLSKGQTGEMNSSLLGLILVSKMQLTAFRRASMPEATRQDFYLYIDEFQNFTTDSIATILSEARKYRLDLILAHQFMPQLTREIRDAVIGNVGSMAAFRVGAEDAEFLEKQFEPEFSRYDLLNIDNFNLIIKMMINNTVSSPFKMKIAKPKEGSALTTVGEIKKLSKLKYARSKAVVEQEIIARSRLGL